MALQRSEISFRRQGSSGLIWDDKLLSGELKKIKTNEEEEDHGDDQENKRKSENNPSPQVQRSRSNGGRAYRTMEVTPTVDPPSPKVRGCGFCGVFGKPVALKSSGQKRKPGGRK